jgi:hypothetical protein
LPYTTKEVAMANGDGLEGLLRLLPDWVKLLVLWGPDWPRDIAEIFRLASIFAVAATLREEGARANLLQDAGRALIAEISARIGEPVPMPGGSPAGE